MICDKRRCDSDTNLPAKQKAKAADYLLYYIKYKADFYVNFSNRKPDFLKYFFSTFNWKEKGKTKGGREGRKKKGKRKEEKKEGRK